MQPLPKPVAYAIMGLVTLVWAVNFGAQFFVKDYQVDTMVHWIFMLVVGGMMGLSKLPAFPKMPEIPQPPADPPKPPEVVPGPKEGP